MTNKYQSQYGRVPPRYPGWSGDGYDLPVKNEIKKIPQRKNHKNMSAEELRVKIDKKYDQGTPKDNLRIT